MVNYMAEVVKMLGVELGEEFKCNNGYTYRLTPLGLVCPEYSTDGYAYSDVLQALLNGEFEVNYKPWKPKTDNLYYYVDQEGCVISNRWWNTYTEILLYKLGNCYRTEEEAEANRDKWAAFYVSDEVLEV